MYRKRREGNGQASGGGVAVSFTPSSAEDLPSVGNASSKDVKNSSSHIGGGALTMISRPELRIVPPERDMTCAADDELRLETPTVEQMEALFGSKHPMNQRIHLRRRTRTLMQQ